MSTVVSFIYDTPDKKGKIINLFKDILSRETFSQQTGMAVFEGFSLPEEFSQFAISLKFRMLDNIEELKNICKRSGVDLYPITGEKGLIGAVAALGFWDNPEFAAKLPSQCN